MRQKWIKLKFFSQKHLRNKVFICKNKETHTNPCKVSHPRTSLHLGMSQVCILCCVTSVTSRGEYHNKLIWLHLTKISRGLFALIYNFVDIVVNLQLLIRCLPDIHPWPHCLPPICRPLWKQVTPSVLCWYPLCEQCYYCCYKLWCQ